MLADKEERSEEGKACAERAAQQTNVRLRGDILITGRLGTSNIEILSVSVREPANRVQRCDIVLYPR